MNPLQWSREHQLAGILFCILGAVGGVLFAWFESPFYALTRGALSGEYADPTRVFLTWLPYWELYWPWPLLGAAIAGLAFYAVELYRSN